MNWLEFGRAMVAIIVSAGVMWTFVNPSTPLLASQMLVGLSVFVSILLGVSTIVEHIGGSNEPTDLSTLAEYFESTNSTRSEREGKE